MPQLRSLGAASRRSIVVNTTFGTSHDRHAFETLVAASGWSLDTWIQAAANEFSLAGKKPEDFHDLLESILYGQLRTDARGLPIEKYLLQVLNKPTLAERNRILEVCEFLENTYKDCSLLGVVRFLIAAAKVDRKPYAIITFNADTLLETLIYMFLRRDHYLGPGPYGHPPYHYKSVDRPSLIAHHQYIQKTNIFHCHGTIKPRQVAVPLKDSRDRLVFLEQEYLRISSTTASWPETLFLFHAQTTRMVFVGLSMSDANVRRWMRASETELALDQAQIFSGTRVNPKHLWVTRRPAGAALERLKLVSMVHLGIRPAWIPEWSDVERALSNMLAIPPTT